MIIGGRYRVVRKLGEGGRGSVYLVMNLRTERFWAGKRLPASSEQPHELEMMKHLKNIHLPQIIDVIQEEQDLWLIMEYVRGIPFDHYIRGGRTLPEEQALETALQVCDALCYLQGHSPPVFHLDIKPENLIRTKEGRVKLVDFGAAWKQDIEQVNEGTDGYAAPEQYDRSAVKDGRTDIYGLGAAIYRIVSGKKYARTLRQGKVPGCGETFSSVILKCLEEKPQERFQDARQLKAALLRVRKGYAKQRAGRQLLCVSAFALPAAAFCVSVMPKSIDFSGEEQWDYGKLVSEARVLPEKESREYYRKAVFMDPGNPDAYEGYLQDAGADGVFSGDEELFLRDLLHTVSLGESDTYEEILEKDPEVYGKLCTRIGVLYRYEYEGSEGKRISSGWFAKAGEAGRELGYFEETGNVLKIRAEAVPGMENGDMQDAEPDMGSIPNWAREAGYHMALSALEMTSMGEGPDEDDSPEKILDLWEILKEGRHVLETEKDPFLRLGYLRDECWQLAFASPDLAGAGVKPEEIRNLVFDIRREKEKISGSGKLTGNEKAAQRAATEIGEAADTVLLRLSGWEQSQGEDERTDTGRESGIAYEEDMERQDR